jgi:uncharacterized Zn finger protein
MPLFQTDCSNLPDFFRSITADDIQDCCDTQIFYRGKDYFSNGHIENIVIVHKLI